MSSIKGFYTKPHHNTAIRIEIVAPDGSGKIEWLEILGVESDIFRQSKRDSEIALYASLSGVTEPEKRLDIINKAKQDDQAKLLARLVTAWSFDEECTFDNVVDLLTNAPFIADSIDMKSSNIKAFIKKK